MISKIRDICKDFSGYSTLHGLHFLFDSPWHIRRFIWFLLLLASASVFVFNAVVGFLKWQKHEVYITTNFFIDKDLKFPSVTICNKNMLKKSKIMGKDGQRFLDGQNHLYSKDWKKIYSQMNASFDIEKEILENGHGAEDVIKETKFASDCQNTSNNMKVKSIFDVRFGMCHTIHIQSTVQELGESYGLAVLLDAEPHEYYGPYSWDGTGFKLTVHAPDKHPDIDVNGIDIPTGFKTNLRIRKKKKIHLEKPYPSKCGAKKLISHNIYSKSTCLLEQYASVVAERCGCRVIGVPIVNEKSKRYCNVSEMTGCTFPALFKHRANDSDCPAECTSESYEVRTSFLVYPSHSVWDELTNGPTSRCGVKADVNKEYNITKLQNESFKDWYRERFARVNVYFTSRNVETIQEVPAFDDLDFAGNLGGNMGLYLGCSVLTLAEFIDLLVLIIVHWLKKKDTKVAEAWSEKQQQSTTELT